ncbi:hypothetical protein JXA47_00265, partial [Candidatus Sumerlaeota bacterium]|nr:hypothetical protein [Candidatus Sumerlaeota bacterium]
MLAYRLTLPRTPEDPLESLPLPRTLLAGLSMGASLLFENLFGLIALFLVAHLLVSQRPALRGIGAVALFTAGTLIALIPLFIYTWAIFGRLAIPYEYEHDPFFREAMASGFMGIHFPPRPTILWLITFHPFRGLFVYSPLLLMAIPGLVALTRLPRGGWRALMCGGVFVGYLIVNGGYTHQWWGGWSCGPRHLIPAVPFLLIAIGAAWGQWRWIRPVIVTLGVISVALQLLAAGIDPQPPTPVPGGDANAYLAQARLDLDYPVPLTTWWLPHLRAGVVAWNPGTLIGVSELWMWGVLVLIWVGFLMIVWRGSDKVYKT